MSRLQYELLVISALEDMYYNVHGMLLDKYGLIGAGVKRVFDEVDNNPSSRFVDRPQRFDISSDGDQNKMNVEYDNNPSSRIRFAFSEVGDPVSSKRQKTGLSIVIPPMQDVNMAPAPEEEANNNKPEEKQIVPFKEQNNGEDDIEDAVPYQNEEEEKKVGLVNQNVKVVDFVDAANAVIATIVNIEDDPVANALAEQLKEVVETMKEINAKKKSKELTPEAAKAQIKEAMDEMEDISNRITKHKVRMLGIVEEAQKTRVNVLNMEDDRKNKQLLSAAETRGAVSVAEQKAEDEKRMNEHKTNRQMTTETWVNGISVLSKAGEVMLTLFNNFSGLSSYKDFYSKASDIALNVMGKTGDRVPDIVESSAKAGTTAAAATYGGAWGMAGALSFFSVDKATSAAGSSWSSWWGSSSSAVSEAAESIKGRMTIQSALETRLRNQENDLFYALHRRKWLLISNIHVMFFILHQPTQEGVIPQTPMYRQISQFNQDHSLEEQYDESNLHALMHSIGLEPA